MISGSNLNYPKILILGETFRRDTGGGITLKNYFKNWDKKSIIVASKSVENVDLSYCNSYYIFGNSEKLIPFIFRNILRYPEKKVLNSEELQSSKTDFSKTENEIKQNRIKKNFLKAVSHFIGIHYLINYIRISNELYTWIKKLNPDVIYFQPNSFADISFLYRLNKKLKLPVVTHVVDDYRNKDNFSLFRVIVRMQSSKMIRNIINQSCLNLSICDEMSEEYYKRFNKIFYPFVNPVDFQLNPVINYSNKLKKFKIIYAGRITIGNIEAISTYIDVVESLQNDGIDILFDIYSSDFISEIIKKTQKSQAVFFKGYLEHSKINETLSRYDLLFLPLSFSKKSIKYTRLSLPTKTSEYMISGVPILIYAPTETALYRYAARKEWAFLISSAREIVIKDQIREIIQEPEQRKKYAEKAYEIASTYHNAENKRMAFEQLIFKALEKTH